MGYDDEAPGAETTGQAQARFAAFALKVSDLIRAEETDEGLGGALCGMGLGMMLGQGVSEEKIRKIFEKTLAGLLAGAAAIVAHEKKTFS